MIPELLGGEDLDFRDVRTRVTFLDSGGVLGLEAAAWLGSCSLILCLDACADYLPLWILR